MKGGHTVKGRGSDSNSSRCQGLHGAHSPPGELEVARHWGKVATLTLGGLIADDEAVYFPQTGCPLQHSSGICHIDNLQMCWRGRHCSQETIHSVFIGVLFYMLRQKSSCT